MTMAPLLGRLHETARAESESRLVVARDEARRQIAGARERLAHRRDALLRTHSEALSRERERRLHEAREAAARRTLAAGDRLVDRVVACALERAAHWARDPVAAEWAGRTIVAAMRFLPEGPVTVRSPDNRGVELARVAAPGRTFRAESGRSPLGIVVASEDGRVVVDVTIEQFLRAERQRLAQAIVARAAGSRP